MENESGEARSPWTRRLALAVAGALALVHFASFTPATQPLVSDVRYYLYFAMRTAAGDVPHLDLFDNKTQLATFLGAGLYRLGEVLGADPLLAIRWGYLALAAGTALLLAALVQRVARGAALPAILAVLAVASFGLLGLMPAIGNVAKLAMVTAATAMALCCGARRWVLAGFFGALAFWDWQVGAVAWAAAFVTAAIGERRRGEALLRVTLGGLLGCAPLLLYYAANGALGACFDQTIVASFFRGTHAMDKGGFPERWARIVHLVEGVSPGRVAWVAASLAGIPVALALVWRGRGDERLRLVLPLTLVHMAVLAFSAIDFQWNGDLFALMHGLAFFQSLLLTAAWWGIGRVAQGRVALRVAGGFVLLGIAVWLARPGPLRAPIELEVPLVQPGVTLADQVEVAERLRPRFESERFVLAEFCELLFLLRAKNPTPFIYWNDATWSRYRADLGEGREATLARLMRLEDPDFVTYKEKLPRKLLGAPYPFESVVAESERYAVFLQVRAATGR